MEYVVGFYGLGSNPLTKIDPLDLANGPWENPNIDPHILGPPTT